MLSFPAAAGRAPLRAPWLAWLPILALLAALPAKAATLFSDRSVFEAAVGTFDVETFSGFEGTGCNAFANVPELDCGGGPLSLDFGDFAVEAFAQPFIAPGALLLEPDLHLRVTGGAALQIGGQAAQFSNFRTTATFVFDAPLGAFGVDKIDQTAGAWEVTLRDLAGSDIESFEVPAGTSFSGWTSTVPFAEIVIEQGDLETMAYDDVTYASVPEPGTGTLLGVGLALVRVARRRRR